MHEVLPKFQSIQLESFRARLDEMLAQHLQKINTLAAQQQPSWESLIYPLDAMDNELEQFWSPLGHLHAVANTPELRACYQDCLPKLSAYEASIGQNQALYQAIKRLDLERLNPAQQKIIEDKLQDFELSGVSLSSENKKQFEALQTELSLLASQFENHVLDAVQDFCYPITDESLLAGLPAHAIHQAKRLAEEKGLPGWALGLDQPTYMAVISYADNRHLRQTLYEAYVTRASELGPSAGRFDNTALISKTLALRFASAELLGHKNFAELSLVTKMAGSTTEVKTFLQDLVHRAHAQGIKESEQLAAWAKEQLHLDELAPWDRAYASEKKKEALYAISEERLRPYFPLPKVLSGLFSIIQSLYGITFEEIQTIDAWHKDVSCYRAKDEQGQLRGYIYMDLFARPQKRGGAWMDSLQSRWKLADGSIQAPIATLTCNFAQSNGVACLSHDELTTLFHEFGHCLHHILTKVDYLSASGIHGVEWDAVELPSQFFENWCWDEEAIQLLSSEVNTHEPLPASEFHQLMAAKNFQSALQLLRQLEFALFDFLIHERFEQNSTDALILEVLSEVRQMTALFPVASYNRFQNSFTHIFAGGYAAGYYSYIWAEVLSADAFSRFAEEGRFNAKTGRDFLRCILEVGGSQKAMQAFQAFRGRKPSLEALLIDRGIV